MRFGNVKEALKRNNVPFDEEELDARLTLLVDTLRGNYDQSRVDEFVRNDPGGDYVSLPKIQYSNLPRLTGGALPPFQNLRNTLSDKTGPPDGPTIITNSVPIPYEPDKDDFLSPWMRWYIEAVSSPVGVGIHRIIFMVIFFVSYLEKLPNIGGLLGAALDITSGASKAATKLMQQGIVSLFGLIPFGGPIGILLASIFGFFAWGLIGAVSFSRQDYAEALSSSFRGNIMYPIGNILADTFDAGNRVFGRIQYQAGKIWGNIKDVLRYLGTFNAFSRKGTDTIIDKVQAAKPELLPGGLGALANKVPGNFGELLKKGEGGLGDLANKVPGGLGDILKKGEGGLGDLANKVPGGLGDMLKKGQGGLPGNLGSTFRQLTGKGRHKSKWKTLRNRFDKTFANS